jgi:O-antigen/teichoic acid export membrane protein
LSESPLKRLLVHASHYSLASLLTTIAGLVSFPLLTRVFSVADYGVMNLVAITVSVGVTFGKVGVQHSILRYHSEVAAGKSRYSMAQLSSTTFYGMSASALVVMSTLVVSTQLIPARWLGDPRLRWLFLIASFLILVQVIESALVNFVRAEQHTKAYVTYQVGKKYLTLGALILAVVILGRGLAGFYFANVLAEAAALAALMFVLLRGRKWPRPEASAFSPSMYRELIAFGVPMAIGYELSGWVLAVGDRYVISAMIGEVPLGLYAAAYNLCQYVQAILIASVGQAILPIYMQMWEQKGAHETSQFISRSLSKYLMIAAPVTAGLAAVGPELLPMLASERYAAAAGVVPWVIAGMAIDGTNAMAGAGLFIHRKTRIIMAIVSTGAILNIVLNVILIPRIGIMGSAIATLISYIFTALALLIAGRRLLPVALPVGTLLRAGGASVAMYFAVANLHVGKHFVTVGVRTALGALVYVAIMIAIARDARELAGKALVSLLPRGGT